MSPDQWQIDLDRQTAVHESGFTVHVDGNLRMPFSVSPTNVPADLSVVQQAALLRDGLLVMQNGPGHDQGYGDYDHNAERPEKKRKIIINKPAYVPPANKPERPVLSLKRNKEEAT